MSYSEPLINQVRVFFLSVGVGFMLCGVYIVTESFFRLFFARKTAFHIADGVFCIISAFVSFFFMVLYNSGRVRLHLILGEALGFFAFYFSFGKRILYLLVKFAVLMRRTAAFVFSPFVIVARSFSEGMKATAGLLIKKFAVKRNREIKGQGENEKKMKKFNFISRIHLKNRDKSV